MSLRAPAILARGACRVLLAGVVAGAAGCGSFWPWGSSSGTLPAPAAVSAPIAARALWSISIGRSDRGFMPAVAGDAVFAAAIDGTVQRVEAASGRVVWSVRLPQAIVAGVGADDDVAAVVTRAGVLVGLSARDGKTLWETPLGAEGSSVPAVGQGLVAVRTSDNRVSAFEADTGKRRWSILRQNPPLVLRQTTSLLVTASTVYAGLPAGKLLALSAQNGAVRWEATLSQPRGATEIERIADVIGTPVASAREICAASYRGALGCLDASSGRGTWARDLPVVAGIDVDARLLAGVDEKGQVHAFSRSGASLWKQEGLAGRGLTAPLSLGPVLVIGDAGGLIHLLSRDDGALAGRFTTDGSAILAPAVAAGRLAVVQTSGGSLRAISLD